MCANAVIVVRAYSLCVCKACATRIKGNRTGSCESLLVLIAYDVAICIYIVSHALFVVVRALLPACVCHTIYV